MNCAECNQEMIYEIDYQLDCSRFRCPMHCHLIMKYNDGKQVEEFNIVVMDDKNSPLILSVANISENIKVNGLNQRISHSEVRHNGWMIFGFDNYMIPFGTTILPGGIILGY